MSSGRKVTMGVVRSAQPLATPGLALRHQPLRLLLSSWPWRSLGYLVTTPVVAGCWLLTCWALLPLAGVPLGIVERWRLAWVDRRPTPDPHTQPPAPGPAGWVRHRLRESASWAELLHGVLLIPLSLLGGALISAVLLVPASLIVSSVVILALLALGGDPASLDPTATAAQRDPVVQLLWLGLGLVLLAAGLYLVVLAAEGQRYLARLLLSEPGAQVADLTRSRARIATAFDDERRRIERDLHDGVQQRLTALLLTLGSLHYQHQHGHDITALIEQGRREAQQAVAELRDLVHGIYPAALREQDLAAALQELADRTDAAGLATTASIDLPDNLPLEVQVGVYFAVSELFTNITNHARASNVTLLARHTPMGISVTVRDDGRGGARPGTGLLGVTDRIEALGGNVTIDSPAAGPTRITLELPCGS